MRNPQEKSDFVFLLNLQGKTMLLKVFSLKTAPVKEIFGLYDNFLSNWIRIYIPKSSPSSDPDNKFNAVPDPKHWPCGYL